MKDSILKTYRLPFLYSAALHIALFLFVFTHSQDSKQPQGNSATPLAMQNSLPQAPIKATSIDSQAVESELNKIKQREEKEAALKQQEFQKLQQAKTQAKAKTQQAQEEFKKIQAAKQQLQKEIQKNKILAEQQKKQALAEQKKAEKVKQEITALKKKQAAEAAELKKQQAAAAELKKKELEKNKKKELEQPIKKSKDQKKDTVIASKDSSEETSKKKLEEETFASDTDSLDIENESFEKKNSPNPNSDSLTDQQLSEIDKYRQLITQSIAQNWIVPDNVDKHLSCELIIRVAPGGAVLSVALAKSSGNPTLDRSAQTAVMKASPLPVPSDSELFNKFRELSLTVRPEDF